MISKLNAPFFQWGRSRPELTSPPLRALLLGCEGWMQFKNWFCWNDLWKKQQENAGHRAAVLWPEKSGEFFGKPEFYFLFCFSVVNTVILVGKLESYKEENEIGQLSTPYTQIKSKWIKYLNVKSGDFQHLVFSWVLFSPLVRKEETPQHLTLP